MPGVPAVVLDEYYYGITAAITVGFQLVAFAIAYTCQFDKVTDFAGAANFMIVAVLTLVLSGAYDERQVMLTVMLLASRLWLALFLLYRVLLRGHDARFDKMRSQFGPFLGFFVFQMLWVWLCSMPVVFVNSRGSQPALGELDYVGLAVFLVGLTFEVGGDLQKLMFKNRPDSRGRHPTGGLYACMRHPNYMGEILIWLGTFLAAIPAFGGHEAAGWASVLSPVFTLIILLFLSGMPSAEGNAQRKYMKTPELAEEYRAYRARTSPLVPVPPIVYAALPLCARRACCCEFAMYECTDEGVGSDGDQSEPSLSKALPEAEDGGRPAAPVGKPADLSSNTEAYQARADAIP